MLFFQMPETAASPPPTATVTAMNIQPLVPAEIKKEPEEATVTNEVASDFAKDMIMPAELLKKEVKQEVAAFVKFDTTLRSSTRKNHRPLPITRNLSATILALTVRDCPFGFRPSAIR